MPGEVLPGKEKNSLVGETSETINKLHCFPRHFDSGAGKFW